MATTISHATEATGKEGSEIEAAQAASEEMAEAFAHRRQRYASLRYLTGYAAQRTIWSADRRWHARGIRANAHRAGRILVSGHF